MLGFKSHPILGELFCRKLNVDPTDQEFIPYVDNIGNDTPLLFDILNPLHSADCNLNQSACTSSDYCVWMQDEGSCENALIEVADEAYNAIIDLGSWSDGINDWQDTEGYRIKTRGAVDLYVSNPGYGPPSGGIIEMPITINLGSGWNLVSYPAQNIGSLDGILSDLIESENLQAVLNQDYLSYIPDYITGGSPVIGFNTFDRDKAYYVNVQSPTSIIITEPQEELEYDDIIIDNSSNRDDHFVLVWETATEAMTVIMDVAEWDNVLLEESDEICIFDGDLCVGVYVVPEGGFPEEGDCLDNLALSIED